jgi:hypothetical protein
MAFTRKGERHLEVTYAAVADMEPAMQRTLLEALRREVQGGRTSILFVVETLDVPAAVPKFWLEVTKELAPGLCAMAIVSDNLVVRTAASGFSVSNRLRRVPVEVRAYPRNDLHLAEQWCAEVRAKAPAAAPRR